MFPCPWPPYSCMMNNNKTHTRVSIRRYMSKDWFSRAISASGANHASLGFGAWQFWGKRKPLGKRSHGLAKHQVENRPMGPANGIHKFYPPKSLIAQWSHALKLSTIEVVSFSSYLRLCNRAKVVGGVIFNHWIFYFFFHYSRDDDYKKE